MTNETGSARDRAVELINEHDRTPGGNRVLLDEAVAVLDDFLAGTGPPPAERACALHDLGRALRRRFVVGQDRADLDRSVRNHRASVAATPPDHEHVVSHATELVYALTALGVYNANRAEVREAAAVAREAIQVATDTGGDVGLARATYSFCLNQEIAAFSDPTLIAEAIEACQAALGADLDQGDRATTLLTLGQLFGTRGRADDLNTAIRYLREAAEIAEGFVLWSVRNQLAIALTNRFPAGDPDDLDEAVGLGRRVWAEVPADHLLRGPAAMAVAMALSERFEHTGRLSDLDEAVSVARAAWETLPADQPRREIFAQVTERLLWMRAQHRPDQAHFDEAIGFQRATAPDATDEAVGLAVRGLLAGDVASREEAAAALRDVLAAGVADPRLAELMRSLQAAIMLMNASGTDVATAAATLDQMVSDLPGDSPVRARVVPMLLAALIVQADATGDPALLDRALTLASEALDRDPADDVRDALRSGMAGSLLARFLIRGREDDLNTAITILAQVLDQAGPADSQRANYLAVFSNAQLLRYRRTGDPAALTAAVEAAENGVRAAYDGQRGTCLAQLAQVLWARHEATGDEAAGRRAAAIEVQVQGALRVASSSGLAPGAHAQAAAQQHLARYGRTGQVRDVEEAVRQLRSLLDSGMVTESQYRDAAGQLGVSLRMRYERTRVGADIDESVAVLSRCVAEEPSEVRRARYLSAWGESLRARFATTGERSDIDTAIERHREALRILDRYDIPSTPAHCALASALQDRAELTGEPEDLHHAVELAERAAARPETNVDERVTAVTVLALALWSRFKFLGERDDLDRSVTVWRQALDAIPEGHRSRVAVLHNLAGVLRLRYEAGGEPADLDTAIETNRAALAAIPADHPDRAAIQSGLAILLQNRFINQGDAEALDESVAQGGQGALHSRSADRAGQFHVYAMSMYLRYQRYGRAADLRRATRMLRASVHRSAEHNPKLPSRLCSLALALQDRYERTGRRRYRAGALTALDRATALVTSPADARLNAARLCGQLHAHHGETEPAAAALRLAVEEVLPQVVWRGLGAVSHQSRLRDFPGLAGDAAALALTVGDPVGALRLLEQGRTLFWAQSLDVWSDRSRLREEQPRLHARLDHVITQLASTGESEPQPMPDAPGGLGAADYRQGVAYRWRLHQEYTRLLGEIRALPGFADFLAPPDVESLRAAASNGPVVVVNVSSYRCDALVLVPDAPGVQVVPLPDLTTDDIETRVAAFASATRSLAPGTDLTGRLDGNQQALSTLEWLWRAVTKPVLDHLGLAVHAGTRPPPRLWWCPTGQLALLPLHAAGSGDDWVGAHVVSSYTPTLRSLLRHREHAAPTRPRTGALVVAMSSTPPIDGTNFAPLPGVRDEVAAVRDHLPGDHTILYDDSARRADILTALDRHRILHFACHGVQDPKDPAASYLAVADGPLRVHELGRRFTVRADLAFLSACATARGDAELADEALHLAAAFNFAGTRHVIGTLWSIGDASAATTAGEVYADISTVDSDLGPAAAVALHRAVVRLRDAFQGDAPLRWAAYLHHGP